MSCAQSDLSESKSILHPYDYDGNPIDMRYSATHKEESRERILDVAAKQFRARGAEAVRVSDLMEAAGLTHGGFYRHWTSKEQLLQEALTKALAEISEQLVAIAGQLPREQALKKVIAAYLSEDHVRNPDLGCALAAMGSEIARMPKELRRVVSEALDAYADRLEFLMPGETVRERRAAFLVLFPSMAGCIMTARAHSSKLRQRQILAAGRALFEQAFCSRKSPKFLEKV